MNLDDYLWCVIVGGLFCFTLGFGMGANDVSNNFGTSIGAKSISLKNAIIIAAIFELLGSIALGATVTDSVRKGVYDADQFSDRPDILLMANMCALIAGTLWLISASRIGLPVSTTHSLVGALLGCGLGMSWSAIKWGFVGTVVASWFLSPLLSAIVGVLYYVLIRKYVLRKSNSVERGFKITWLLVFLTVTVCSVFFMWSNPITLSGVTCTQKNSDGEEYMESPCSVNKWVKARPWMALLVSLGIGVALTVILCPFVYWRAKRSLRNFDLRQEAAAAAMDLEAANAEMESVQQSNKSLSLISGENGDGSSCNNDDDDEDDVIKKTSTSPTQASMSIDGDVSMGGCRGKVDELRKNMPWNQDLHTAAQQDDAKIDERAKRAEHFDPRCEVFFMTLQIISASLGCLLHGSNDVANAAAPYASVYDIYRRGEFESTIQVPLWILVLGGGAISVGLTFLGHRVIRRVGIELLYVSPSRGFCIEIASSTIMLIGSFSGLPLSTTHVVVGAMLGVGLVDKKMRLPEDEVAPSATPLSEKTWCGLNFSAINWKIVRQIASAWVGTLLICAILSYLIFSFAIHSPTQNAYEFCEGVCDGVI